jgi:cytochrome c553
VSHRAGEDDAELDGAEPVPPAAATHRADPAHGAVLAIQGSPGGAPACALCHAFNGVSDGSGAFPRIAAQSAYYLGKQLYAFRTGLRANAIMSPIAKRLSDADIADVSAYYAGVAPVFPPLANSTDAALLRQGARLAMSGKPALGLPACEVCHGADGAGEKPTIPYLAGQYAQYLSFELTMWTSGYRRTSGDVMALIAPQLDAGEIAAVAAYYQQLATPAAIASLP